MKEKKPKPITEQVLRELYYDQYLSFAAIAEQLGRAESTVRYYFKKKFKLKPRSKSEAQQLFLENNEHQRAGTIHREDSKEKISQNSSKYWRSNKAKNVKANIQEKRKEWWDGMSDSERTSRLQAMQQGAKDRAGIGSHFEEYLADFLVQEGFNIIQRTDSYTPGNAFVVDMVLPDYGTVIEIDGPVHFEVVFDEETLEKHKLRDDRKKSVLLNAGLAVVRIRNRKTTRSKAKCRRIHEKLKSILDKQTCKVYVIEAD